MPNFDATGPMGQGPRTGRGMGNCGGGMRRGFGFGAGFGRRRFISPKNQTTSLEEKEKILEEELRVVREEKEALKDQDN